MYLRCEGQSNRLFKTRCRQEVRCSKFVVLTCSMAVPILRSEHSRVHLTLEVKELEA
jgi:hypothetical protein